MNLDRTINIALVGVGGQGILLAADILARAAMLAGADVKKSEIHGMAQRGGSVVSQVRIGPKVYAPLISPGDADILVSFELLEALRHAEMLAPTGFALLNRQVIMPVTVSSGQQPPVDDLDARLARAFPRRLLVDGLEIARTLGNLRTVNIVLAGALSRHLPLPPEAWERALTELVPPRHRDINLRAFAAGCEVGNAKLSVV